MGQGGRGGWRKDEEQWGGLGRGGQGLGVGRGAGKGGQEWGEVGKGGRGGEGGEQQKATWAPGAKTCPKVKSAAQSKFCYKENQHICEVASSQRGRGKREGRRPMIIVFPRSLLCPKSLP